MHELKTTGPGCPSCEALRRELDRAKWMNQLMATCLGEMVSEAMANGGTVQVVIQENPEARARRVDEALRANRIPKPFVPTVVISLEQLIGLWTYLTYRGAMPPHPFEFNPFDPSTLPAPPSSRGALRG